MHVDFSDIKIKDFYVHRVGNKANDEASGMYYYQLFFREEA